MNDPGGILMMTEWASRFGCTISVKGEVGFGRPCVGILYGQTYVDYDYQLTYKPEFGGVGFWTPEDAYHKHDCLAVLVYDDDYDKALGQLIKWVEWMVENNLGISTQARETYNKDGFGRELELMMGGLTQAKVVRL